MRYDDDFNERMNREEMAEIEEWCLTVGCHVIPGTDTCQTAGTVSDHSACRVRLIAYLTLYINGSHHS